MRTHVHALVVFAVIAMLAGASGVDAQNLLVANHNWLDYTSASAADTLPSASAASDAIGSIGYGTKNSGSGCSLWTVTADALFLERRDPSPAVLAFNVADPTQGLHASDFNFTYHAGFDLALTRQFGCGQVMEFRYFGIDRWNAGATAATTPGDLLQWNAAVPVFTFSGDAISADYASQLHNVEINARHQLFDRLNLLAGFRYAELDESLSASLVNSAVPFNYTTDTRNRLYGFQLGGEASLWNRGGPFALDAVGKAGIFGNESAQNGAISTGLVTLPAIGGDSRTAFIGEIGITGSCQLTDRLAVRGGYRLLWIDGVALASDQLSVSDFANNRGFDRSGTAFYHGAFAGLEYQW
jgi:hypothetical protein